MAIVQSLTKRRNRRQTHVDRPATVTGDFELHYEEIVRRNRFALIAILATGLIAVAAFIPTAVYHSVAGTKTVIVEPEEADLSGSAKVGSDSMASGGKFIIFTDLTKKQ